MPKKEKVTDDAQPIIAKLDAIPTDGDLGGKEDEGKEEPVIPKVLIQPYKPKIPFP